MDDNDGVGLNIYNIFNREEDIIIFIFQMKRFEFKEVGWLEYRIFED